nr:MAG: ORF1 [Torque teno midi virus]
MPFWWNRRRRPWFYNKRRYKTRRYTRTRRRRFPRRKYRRPARRSRRRRRRRHKVRRKKQTLIVRQWQPDSIVKCHIKGLGQLIVGAEGKQWFCYTNVYDSWTPPKVPGGGGLAVQQFSLGYLYREYQFRRNIWTKTNILKDLCRYLLVKFTFYRHLETDFIVMYERQLPFEINKFTYPSCHPVNLLLQKHKKIILSKQSKPFGKQTVKFKVKPPKQMLSKWFFSSQFSSSPLLLLKATAANFNYSAISETAPNTLIEMYYLNTAFYVKNGWGQSTPSNPYKPYLQAATQYKVRYIDGKIATISVNPSSPLDYSEGYFQSGLLRAVQVATSTTSSEWTATTPINVTRYNPNRDNGKGNSLWLISTFNSTYQKPTDEVLHIDGLPLWMGLYGYLQYVTTMKKDKNFLDSYILAIQSPALEPAPQIGSLNWCMPLDKEFIEGKGPFGSYVSSSSKTHWGPNVWSQLKILNAIVESGPYIPKYSERRNSSWELDYKYDFLFKWGGPQITDPAVTDPSKQSKYDVPDTLTASVQVRDPAKQKAASILHSWDYRRGIITETALKRMSEHIDTDTTFQPDSETIPYKKKKITGPALQNPQEEQEEIQSCLLSLFEESTCQETQDPAKLHQLINQQHQYQQQLKYNLLRLIQDLKDKQRLLQLHTGMLE